MGYAPIQGTIGGVAATQKVVTANGSFNLPNGVTEVDFQEFLSTDDKITVSMDFFNLTEKLKIRIKEKVDGITYRLVQLANFPKDFDGPQANLTIDGKGRDMKITFQSEVAEGSVKVIPNARVEVIRCLIEFVIFSPGIIEKELQEQKKDLEL